MKTSLILTGDEGAVRTITLHRPEKLNAINSELVSGLCTALVEANLDRDIKVIILKGSGRAFCAGADLTAENLPEGLSEAERDQKLQKESEALQEVTRQILFSDKIVIGAVHGWAVGAGFEWAINCDFSIWVEGARGFFPEAKWGLSVTGAVTSLLPALVGPMKARELILLGEKQTALALYEMGVIWKVVAEKELDREINVLCDKLTALLPRSLSTLKRAINIGSYADLDRTLDYESRANVDSIKDPQTKDRILTFSNVQ